MSVASLFMAAVIAFSGYSHGPDGLFRQSQVFVKDCNERAIYIYADKNLTVPLANPFISDRDGKFTFFTVRQEMHITYTPPGSKYTWTMSTCLSDSAKPGW